MQILMYILIYYNIFMEDMPSNAISDYLLLLNGNKTAILRSDMRKSLSFKISGSFL